MEQFEYEFLKALHSSEHLGSPNALRAAIALDVLVKVGSKFARFEPLLTTLSRELETSTYVPQKEGVQQPWNENGEAKDSLARRLEAAMRAGISRRTFFSELKDIMAEKAVVQDEVYVVVVAPEI